MKQVFFKGFLVAPLVFFFSFPLLVQAASLYIDPPFNSLYRGDTVTLSIRLDTDETVGECINAVDGVITYTSNIEPVDVSIGSSIFSIWVEPPIINRNDRTITFAGGIPNGYCGRVTGDPRLTNTLAQIVFRSPGFSVGGSAEVEANVSLTNETTAYLNDGLGTKARLATYPAKILLYQTASSSLTNPWQDEVSLDKTPPNQFSIELLKDDNAFSQRYYIVFNTTDKETGISHYEVMEESLNQLGTFQWGRADAPWIVARSPYVLKDQTLNSIIRVRAVDKAGNEYISNLIPDDSMRTLTSSQILFSLTFLLMFVVFGLMVIALFFFFIKSKKKARLSKTDITDSAVKIPDQDLDGEDVLANDDSMHDNK